jgi:UDP-galactopyranose mutase
MRVESANPCPSGGWFHFLKERPKLPAGKHVFYSGPVDELLGWRFGPLPWRTLRFELENAPVADWQGTSVVNYVDADVPYTRIHEFKHFHPEDAETMARPCTTICREYPATWKPGDEPYYPVDCEESRALLAKYREEAAKVPNLIVGGRLGGYKYFDMDQSIAAALAVEI